MPRKHTRPPAEMFELILETARADERVRAVVLNGSRVNPIAKKDAFQDYDVVYVVTEMDSFIRDPDWIQRFGEILILQTPDDMGEEAALRDMAAPRDRYAWLAQFRDGNRIDLTLVPVDRREKLLQDSLRVLLLDKDGLFPPFPPSDDSSYHIQPPTEKQYDDCCNEILWVSPYAAKGLWRDEPIYTRHALEVLVRPQLMKMLAWHAGMRHGYAIAIGSYAKRLRDYLDPVLWRMLEKTWVDGEPEHTWDALFLMGNLFRRAAAEVGSALGYAYPEADHRRVTAFLRHIRRLPHGAERLY
ncbi:MAG TPA: aminoglycoside 6-adenylyltransferase [Clostridia bacterium]